MNKSPRLLMVIGMAVVALTTSAGITATATTPAFAGSHEAQGAVVSLSDSVNRVSHSGATADITPKGAFDNCPQDYWCLYSGLNGNPLCWSSLATVRYLSDYDCRNLDVSFANRTGGLVRMYYSPNLKGDWVCVNSGWYSNALYNEFYVFNNGPIGNAQYGTGQSIYLNVASIEVGSGEMLEPAARGGLVP
jgi:Peptidase inhibitor family I36